MNDVAYSNIPDLKVFISSITASFKWMRISVTPEKLTKTK